MNDQQRRNKTATHRKGNTGHRREDDRANRAARHQRQERLSECRMRELSTMAS